MIASKLFTVTFTPEFEGVTRWTVPADNALHAAAICAEVGEEMAASIKAQFEIVAVSPVIDPCTGKPMWVRLPQREPDKIETLEQQPISLPPEAMKAMQPKALETVTHEAEEEE